MIKKKYFIRLRNDGRYEGREKLKDPSGKTIYKSLYGNSYDEVLDKMDAVPSIKPRDKPVSKCKPVSSDETRVLSPNEQKHFLMAASSNPYGDLLRFQLFTGLRIGEVLALKWGDVDLDKLQITISRSLGYKKSQISGKYALTLSPTKCKNLRDVPLTQSAVDVLLLYRDNENTVTTATPDIFIFTNYKSKLIPRRYIDKALLDIRLHMEQLMLTSVKPFSTHALRHTFATRLLEENIPIKVISQWLGHSTIKVTGDTYGHVSPHKLCNCIEVLNNVF